MNYSCLRLNSFACGANHPGVQVSSFLISITFIIPLQLNLTVLMQCHTLHWYVVHVCFLAKWKPSMKCSKASNCGNGLNWNVFVWHQRVELVNVCYKLQLQMSKSSFFFFFCLFWTNQEFQSAASVLSSVDKIHFLIDFTFLLRHGNPSPTHVAFLSVMIFGGFFFFLLSLLFLCAVDVFEREREKIWSS